LTWVLVRPSASSADPAFSLRLRGAASDHHREHRPGPASFPASPGSAPQAVPWESQKTLPSGSSNIEISPHSDLV